MVKGDDALAKKRNKATRKKIRRKEGSTSSAVSARVASLIASKKRRQAGVRRKCQGMCFSLPNPEDPFNDKLGKGGAKKQDTEKAASLVGKPHREEESGLKLGKRKTNAVVSAGDVRKESLKIKAGDLNRPSKFLTLCLNAIEKSMHGNNGEERPLFVDSWGVEFLKCYLSGENVVETSGVPCTTEQIAWIVSVAADTITRKEKEGLSIATPFLLFLVSSQEKATKVLFREDATVDDLIDVIEGNRKYMKCIYVYNKIDVVGIDDVDKLARQPNSVVISCNLKLNFDRLLAKMWEAMGLVRVYTKPQGQQPDFGDPVVLSADRGGCTVEDFCNHIHRSLLKDVKYVLVWGSSARHYPQHCGLGHLLQDEDVVQIVKKKEKEDGGRGRFKSHTTGPDRISDRVKKAPLKT